MPDEEFGAGPALDENLDFFVGPTNDLAHEDGIDELEKDLSVNMIAELTEFVGPPSTPNVRSQIAQNARLTALADERISAVNKGDVDVTINENREISVSMTVKVSGDEEYDLVFNV